jgi:hypothetical protein
MKILVFLLRKVADFEVVILGFQPILFEMVMFLSQSQTDKHILKVGDFAEPRSSFPFLWVTPK